METTRVKAHLLDGFWDLDNCNSFCKQWQETNIEQVEFLTGSKVKLVFVSKIGPKQYDLNFMIGKRLVDWFGSACCSYAAVAKALQAYYEI